jgi:hypothetical protein
MCEQDFIATAGEWRIETVQTEMTATDIRDIVNHSMHFGPAALVRKGNSGSKRWWVAFRDFGFPCPFATKTEAVERAAEWVRMLTQRRRENA